MSRRIAAPLSPFPSSLLVSRGPKRPHKVRSSSAWGFLHVQLIIGINFEEIDFDKHDAVDKIMDDFDTSGNDTVEESEFIEGMRKWLNEARNKVQGSGASSDKFSVTTTR